MTAANDDTSDPAELSASAAKWLERARAAELARDRHLRPRETNGAKRLAATETYEDQKSTFYSVEDVAERLSVCSRTIRNWIRDGRLPAHRPGKKLIISKSDVDNFVAGSRAPQR